MNAIILLIALVTFSGCAHQPLMTYDDIYRREKASLDQVAFLSTSELADTDLRECESLKLKSDERKNCISEFADKWNAKINLNLPHSDPSDVSNFLKANHVEMLAYVYKDVRKKLDKTEIGDEDAEAQAKSVLSDPKLDTLRASMDLLAYEILARQSHLKRKSRQSYSEYQSILSDRNERALALTESVIQTTDLWSLHSEVNRLKRAQCEQESAGNRIHSTCN